MERKRVGIRDRLKNLLGNRVSSKGIEKQDTGEIAASGLIIQDLPEAKYVAYINNAFQRGVDIFGLVGTTDVRFDKAKRIVEVMCNDFGFTEKTGDFRTEDMAPSRFKAFIFVVDGRAKKK